MAKGKGGKEHTQGGLHSAAVRLGHAGGLRGGPARAAALSPNERTKIARMGGEARASQQKKK